MRSNIHYTVAPISSSDGASNDQVSREVDMSAKVRNAELERLKDAIASIAEQLNVVKEIVNHGLHANNESSQSDIEQAQIETQQAAKQFTPTENHQLQRLPQEMVKSQDSPKQTIAPVLLGKATPMLENMPVKATPDSSTNMGYISRNRATIRPRYKQTLPPKLKNPRCKLKRSYDLPSQSGRARLVSSGPVTTGIPPPRFSGRSDSVVATSGLPQLKHNNTPTPSSHETEAGHEMAHKTGEKRKVIEGATAGSEKRKFAVKWSNIQKEAVSDKDANPHQRSVSHSEKNNDGVHLAGVAIGYISATRTTDPSLLD